MDYESWIKENVTETYGTCVENTQAMGICFRNSGGFAATIIVRSGERDSIGG